MKLLEPGKDWPARVTACLACGGVLMALILCLFIGFGLNTDVGREALYIAVLMQAANVAVIRLHERKIAKVKAFPPSSRKMTVVRLSALNLWRVGAICLLLSVFLTLFGVSLADLWVKLTCWVGSALLFLGWSGILICYHRRHQAAIAYARELGLSAAIPAKKEH